VELEACGQLFQTMLERAYSKGRSPEEVEKQGWTRQWFDAQDVVKEVLKKKEVGRGKKRKKQRDLERMRAKRKVRKRTSCCKKKKGCLEFRGLRL